MKDITRVIELLKTHHISQAEYAKEIGTSRQNVTNWTTSKDGIPKRFVYPTYLFLKKRVNKKIKLEELLTIQENDNDNANDKAIINE